MDQYRSKLLKNWRPAGLIGKTDQSAKGLAGSKFLSNATRLAVLSNFRYSGIRALRRLPAEAAARHKPIHHRDFWRRSNNPVHCNSPLISAGTG
jgi:hypothetical protein